MDFDNFMEIGELIPLSDGWFMDKNTGIRFRIDENGNAVDGNGDYIADRFNDDEDDR